MALKMLRLKLCISILVIVLKFTSALSHRDRSLIFVIDNTVSMADEIKQLQDSFDSIIDVILTNSSQIENVVLVTFNDPDWTCPIQEDNEVVNKMSYLVSKSMDRKLLKYAINSITAHGGGDGPEYSLTGILDALRNSSPNSYIFVFTDASSKDYQLIEKVKSLAQEKGTQIFFVLTPNCNEDEGAYDPYYDIATATFGHVFRLRKKSEVQQIINYLLEVSSGERTILLAKSVPGGRIENATFTVDEQIEYIVILASGENVTLSENLGEKITWLSNVKATKLKNLSYGDYNITIGGKTMTSVLVYGITNSTFEYGFFDNTPDLTSKSCVLGTKKHLAIFAKDGGNINLESVQISDSSSNLLRELQLKKTDDYNYTTELFTPPNSTFLITVKGKVIATGTPIKRIARTPTVPKMESKDQTYQEITANETSAVTIECDELESKPETKIIWKFRSMMSNETTELPEKRRSMTIGKVHLNNAGYYTCTAQNIFGVHNKTVRLKVLSKPTVSISSEVKTIDYNSNLTLSCKVIASPKPNIQWKIDNIIVNETMSSKVSIQDEGNFSFTSNLTIQHIKRSQEYTCKASKGEIVEKYYLTINYPFENNNTEEEIKVLYGGNTTLNCTVESSVPLSYEWYKSNGIKLRMNTTSEIMSSDGRELKIYNVTSIKTKYECKASILDDEDIYTIHKLNVKSIGKRPKIDQSLKEIKVNETSSVTIECKILDSVPEAKIKWLFRPLHETEAKPLSSAGNTIKIKNVSLSDEGIYTCKAENQFGFAINTVNLTVTAPPKIEKKHDKEKIPRKVGGNVIKCKIIKGNPTPKIQWYKLTSGKKYKNYEVWSENKEEIVVHEPGYYKCEAENIIGKDEKIVEIVPGGRSA